MNKAGVRVLHHGQRDRRPDLLPIPVWLDERDTVVLSNINRVGFVFSKAERLGILTALQAEDIVLGAS